MKHPSKGTGIENRTTREGMRQMPNDPNCSYCVGKGEIKGTVDDVEFAFPCSCSGGSEEAVRWLLGLNEEPPPGQDWII